MDIKPTSYRYDGEGIECAYRNEKWVVCIKNWKPNNDIDGLEHLEIDHTTDEQFILISVGFIDNPPINIFNTLLLYYSASIGLANF